ncbi:unnamed protein product [Musa hybrid cultivar]
MFLPTIFTTVSRHLSSLFTDKGVLKPVVSGWQNRWW